MTVGVFDSGLGGLCAVREILKIMPGEDIIYFGDTGRVPYGNKSYENIKKYGRQSVNFLLEKNVKVILAACGTVSSVALSELRAEFPGVIILGIIEGACDKAVKLASVTGNKKIGVIGTQTTISKGAFARCISGLDADCAVYEQACPLFVPLVENGHISDGLTRMAAECYLGGLREAGPGSLILGCTHYPMISGVISEFMRTELIDAGAEAAHKLKQVIKPAGSGEGSLQVFISDEGMNFAQIASNFLGFEPEISKIDIEKY